MQIFEDGVPNINNCKIKAYSLRESASALTVKYGSATHFTLNSTICESLISILSVNADADARCEDI